MHILLAYRIALFFYQIGIYIASIGNDKARLWIQGRKNSQNDIPKHLKILQNRRPIWFHCASLGEFEQGRPIIEALKLKYPQIPILLSFFSPSGYEIRKDYAFADVVTYLPLDSPSSAKKFIKTYQPLGAIFVKYEFWYYFIHQLHLQGIPSALVSAHFHAKNFRLVSRAYFAKILPLYSQLFVQSKKDIDLLTHYLNVLHSNQITIAGDNRFDRVVQIAANPEPVVGIEEFINGRKCLVAGSVWQPDTKILLEWLLINPNFCLILVPHDVNKEQIQTTQALLPNLKIYSEWLQEYTTHQGTNSQVLLIDTIGLLSRLYKYSWCAYVGGGFGKGIHNILEACVYGKPILFGTNYQRFQEAHELIQIKVAYSVKSSAEISSLTNLWQTDSNLYSQICQNATQYVADKKGATATITQWVSGVIHSE